MVFSKDEITILKTTWTAMKTLGDEIPRYHYNLLFQENPEFKKYFRGKIEKHSLDLLQSIDRIVTLIEQNGDLERYLTRLGIRHRGYRIKRKNQYNTFKHTLFETFEWALEESDLYDNNSQMIWTKFINTIITIMMNARK